MPYQFDEIKPGLLIKADLWLRMISAITDIDTRLTKLESVIPTAGKMVITSVTPLALKIGETLHVTGRNFGIPQMNGLNIAGNDVSVAFLPPSDDTNLTFAVPGIPGIQAGGNDVTLSVSGPNGFAQVKFHLSPGQVTVPTATLFVAMTAPPALPAIGAGVPLLFEYTVSGASSLADSYVVTPKVDAGWVAVLAKDVTGAAKSPPEIDIPQSNSVSVKFLIAVTVPVGTPKDTIGILSVKLESKLSPATANGASPALPLSVGNAPPGAQDDVITIVQNVFPPVTMLPPNATVGGTIFVPASGVDQRVDLLVRLKTADDYDVSIVFDKPIGWTATAIPTSIPKTSTTSLLTLRINAKAVAAATIMRVTITSHSRAGIQGTLAQAVQPV